MKSNILKNILNGGKEDGKITHQNKK